MTTGAPVIAVFYLLLVAVTCSRAFHTKIQELHRPRGSNNEARDLFVGNFLMLESRAKRNPAKGRIRTASLRSDFLREMCARLRRYGDTRTLITYCSVGGSVFA